MVPVNATPTDYDPRYLGGIQFFNERDFFEAHEVWEGLWMECAGPERRFYQGLIQAAVALFHFSNGNLRGAIKLYHSSRGYLERFGPSWLGLNVGAFLEQMARCFADVLAAPNPDPSLRPQEDRMPIITLDPAPAQWPDPAEFITDEEGEE
jgi:predicted metal-dependent hydrolase